MKNLILILSIFVSLNLGAKGKKESSPSFQVVSDKFDATIPKGKYVLEGKVIDVYSNSSIKFFEINLQTGEVYKMKKGVFKLQLPANDEWIHFTKEDYQSAYFENYEPKSQHRIKIKVFLNQRGRGPEISTEKPVIYAYNSSDIDVSIKLNPVGNLCFTYPQISPSNSWEMTLKNNNFVDSKGNEYPYLFWDSKQKGVKFMKNENGILFGEVLAKEDVISYLDSTLSAVGFNSREKTDFITYWGPKLTQNNYVFMQFMTQNECKEFADYTILPKPDHFNRFYMLFTGYEKLPGKLELVPNDFVPFKRDGFHVLEWGGSEVDVNLEL
ncbi:MAG: hypothetical protein V4622_00990 [Bacteroidota bacterium]